MFRYLEELHLENLGGLQLNPACGGIRIYCFRIFHLPISVVVVQATSEIFVLTHQVVGVMVLTWSSL